MSSKEVNSAYRTVRNNNGLLHDYCGAWIKDYEYLVEPGQNWYTYTNLIFNPATGTALRLRGNIRIAYWDKYSGTCGELGLPTTDDLWAARSPQGTTGAYQKFDNGTMHSSARGTFATIGELDALYTSLGGTASSYGFPIDEQFKEGEKECQLFEGGKLCTELAGLTCNSIYQISDKIYSYYTSNGGCEKFGAAMGNIEDLGGSDHWWGGWQGFAYRQIFENGDIYYYERPYGVGLSEIITTHTQGLIRTYYNQMGAHSSVAGLPREIEKQGVSSCGTSSITGEHQLFDYGKIYRSELSTTFMLFENYKWLLHYVDAGEVEGSFGWPVTPVYMYSGVEMMNFEKGKMIRVDGFANIGWWIADDIWGCGCQIEDSRGQCVKFIGESIAGKSDAEVCQMAIEGRIAVIDEYSTYVEQCDGAHYLSGYVTDTETGEIIPAASLGLLGTAVLSPIPGDEVILGAILGLIGIVGLVALATQTGAAQAVAKYISQSRPQFGNIDPEKPWNSEPDPDLSDLEKAARDAYDHASQPNKLNHYFGKAGHNISSLANEVGGYKVLVKELIKKLYTNLPAEGVFETIIEISGKEVTLRGTVINGVAKLSTVFIP